MIAGNMCYKTGFIKLQNYSIYIFDNSKRNNSFVFTANANDSVAFSLVLAHVIAIYINNFVLNAKLSTKNLTSSNIFRTILNNSLPTKQLANIFNLQRRSFTMASMIVRNNCFLKCNCNKSTFQLIENGSNNGRCLSRRHQLLQSIGII
jgi:hypothetical protein